MSKTPHLLVLTTLFPNSEQPRHGIFVETRLRQLVNHQGFGATVIAPVPWFPFKIPGLPRYSIYSRVPKIELRDGITVHHPRYLVIPKIGFIFAPLFLAWSFWWCARSLKKTALSYDLVDAHYYYPDGVAAVLFGAIVNKPVVITARGSDINVLPGYRVPRSWISFAARKARAHRQRRRANTPLHR